MVVQQSQKLTCLFNFDSEYDERRLEVSQMPSPNCYREHDVIYAINGITGTYYEINTFNSHGYPILSCAGDVLVSKASLLESGGVGAAVYNAKNCLNNMHCATIYTKHTCILTVAERM